MSLYMYIYKTSLQSNKRDVISKIVVVILWKSFSMSTVLSTVFAEKLFEVDVITSLLIGDIVQTRKINSCLSVAWVVNSRMEPCTLLSLEEVFHSGCILEFHLRNFQS